jgi:hexosaminidase
MKLPIALLLGCIACPIAAVAESDLALVPWPASVHRQPGEFSLDERTVTALAPGAEDFTRIAGVLAAAVREQTGLDLRLAEKAEADRRRVQFQRAPAAARLGDEGYQLTIRPTEVVLRAEKPAGAFYAVQSLRQLLRPVEGAQQRRWTIPCLSIEDRPRFRWRGMHLDVARHFFDKGFVKRYIDHLAACKINVFHLYLTDDQGWRMEIRRYPRLTDLGAWRNGTRKHYWNGPGDTKRYGGFYTQDELREIVAYAAERFITVVPGVSMPGHSQAALAAYPELSSTGGPFEVWTEWGISKEVMDPGKEEVFRFVEGVLTEVIDVFPSRQIHTGGDEVPRDRWKASPFAQARMQREGLKDEDELQSYFTRRVEKFLNSKGRELIGWDEILEGGLAPNAVVMSWRGTKGGIAAAKAGHRVVMTPHAETYFNYMPQKAKTGPGHPGYLPLEAVYRFEPLVGLSEAESAFVLGGQGCLWTEYVPAPADVERLLFPRLLAMAEVLWSPQASRDLPAFLRRLAACRP